MYAKSLRLYRKTRYYFDWTLNQFVRNRQFDISRLKEKHRGKPMLIVGNGPSLTKTPLDKFGISSIGMNKIDLIFTKTTWRPNYIFCVNGLVMVQNKEFFKATDIPVFLDLKALYMGIFGKNITYFLNSPNTVFTENFNKGLAQGATVTFFGLQFAYLVGADPVILVGVDHSFNTKNESASSIRKMSETDTNHFDPNYFQKGSLWGIPDLENSEINYEVAKRKFEDDGRKIYDATIGGKLQVFDRISIEDALKFR